MVKENMVSCKLSHESITVGQTIEIGVSQVPYFFWMKLWLLRFGRRRLLLPGPLRCFSNIASNVRMMCPGCTGGCCWIFQTGRLGQMRQVSVCSEAKTPLKSNIVGQYLGGVRCGGRWPPVAVSPRPPNSPSPSNARRMAPAAGPWWLVSPPRPPTA